MKKLFTLLMLTVSFSVSAQMVDNSPNTNSAGIYSVAMGDGTSASGDASTAMGYQTTASGDYSIAMGNSTTANGWYSTAMGLSTTASGTVSTAMGGSTTASGIYSTAMGKSTTASDFASTVIGQYNSSGSSATSANSFSTSAPAFVIGNGTASNAKSDAFKVMFNGDTYISSSLYIGGTAITSTAAEINLLDGVTAVGSGILSSTTESGNTGVRLSTSNSANHGDIGSNAVDLSYQNSTSSTKGATGFAATALGYLTTASGNRSTAIGNNTIASGHQSTSMGELTTASGRETLAIGNSTTASGNYSTAMGLSTTASGAQSTAMGRLTTASGISSLALGYSTTASGHQSISAGNSSTASASYSTSIGYGSVASDFASVVIGQYNSSGSSVTNNATSFNTANTAFVIGNGADSSNKSDAFKVMFNGDTTVSNDLTVSGDVVISSDARLKSNIVSLGSTLPKLLQIDGKSYEMKGKQKIGVLAQEIQEVFPELVSEDANEMLAVNYQGLVPVLINALKEQETKFEKQQAEINELKDMVQELASRD